MSKFSAFMAENVTPLENKKIVISKRFKDENGNPIEWEIRPLTAEETEDLQRMCMVNVPVQGQRGRYTRELDDFKYTKAMLCASVVFPDLRNAELQDSYGVKSPEQLLKKMLTHQEEAKLGRAIVELSETEDFGDLVDDAKN